MKTRLFFLLLSMLFAISSCSRSPNGSSDNSINNSSPSLVHFSATSTQTNYQSDTLRFDVSVTDRNGARYTGDGAVCWHRLSTASGSWRFDTTPIANGIASNVYMRGSGSDLSADTLIVCLLDEFSTNDTLVLRPRIRPMRFGLTLDSVNTSRIAVGGSTTRLLAQVHFERVIYSPVGVPVRFTIVNAISFGTAPYRPALLRTSSGSIGYDTLTAATDDHGVAGIYLLTGNRAGNVQVAAEVLNPTTGQPFSPPIRNQYANLAIIPGAPDSVDWTIDSLDFQQEGGGIWTISLPTITVRDRFRNLIHSSFSYSVSPESLAVIVGGSTPRLQFHGLNTMDTVLFTCTDTLLNLTVRNRFALPLLGGYVQLTSIPGTCFFTSGRETATLVVYALIRDGYGSRIPRVPVEFTTQYGHFYKTTTEAASEVYNPPLVNGLQNGIAPNVRRTGNYSFPVPGYTDPNGIGTATLYLRVNESDVFTNPEVIELNGEINAHVPGYNIQSARYIVNYQRSTR